MTLYHDDTKKLPPKDEDVRLVLDNYNRSRDELVTDVYREKCITAHKTYRAIVEEPSSETDDLITTDLVIPLGFEHIESIHPRMVANNPRIEVWGRGKEDSVRAAQHRALLMYYWERLGVSMKLLHLNKQALVTGTAWAKIYWRTETRTRKTVTFETPTFMGFKVPGVPPQRREGTGPVKVYDLPQIDLLDNDEVFPDPDGYSVETCDWIIHRRATTLAELEALDWPEDGGMKDLREKVEDANTQGEPFVTIAEDMHQEVGSEAQRQPDPHKRQMHLLERWDDERVIVTVEEHPDIRPLRKEFHGIGMKPFARYTPIPSSQKSIFGIGMIEILYPFIIETSALHQARIDNVKHLVHKMPTIRMDSQIDPKQIVRRPGGWIDVIEHDDIRPFDMGEITFAAYRETEALAIEAQRTSGANDIVQGVGGPRAGGTATQAQLLAQATASRTTLMFKILSEQFLKRVGRLLVRLSDLNMTTERVIRIGGSEFADTQFNPQEMAQAAQGLLAGAQPDESLEGQPVSVAPQGLVERLSQSVQGFEQSQQAGPGPGFTQVTPEGLASGSDVDLDLTIDIAEADPEVRVTRQQRGINALSVFSNFLPPTHPVMEEFMIEALEGFGKDRAEQKVQQGRQILAQQQAAAAAQQGGQSGAQTPGDQLAINASQGAPSGDRQV